MSRMRLPMLMALVGLLTTAGLATADAVRVKAHVPFEFIVADQTLPAGDYTFMFQDPTKPGVLVVQRRSGQHVEVALAAPEETARPLDKSKLVFDQFEGKYYLAEVWAAGRDEGRVIPESKIRNEEGRVAGAVTVLGNK